MNNTVRLCQELVYRYFLDNCRNNNLTTKGRRDLAARKMRQWFTAPNPLLSDCAPRVFLKDGQEERLLLFIQSIIEELE